jgi:hypothetical protein
VEIVNFLAVDKSARYQPGAGKTYCNIYAYDYCYLGDVYLPRVWWNGRAIGDLKAGQSVEPKYGVTIIELNANALHDWLNEWGDDFGWVKTTSLTELQDMANRGRVALICAKRKDTNRSGHIVAVVPEQQGLHVAVRSDEGEVVKPLASQAGVRNFRFEPARDWWQQEKFADHGFWYTNKTRKSIPIS